MKNKEIEELLNKMKNCNGVFDYYLEYGEVDLLLSYIEQLENKNKENSLLLIEFQDMEQRIEQLENNRDKALKFIKENSYKKGDGTIMYDTDIQELENILKGGSE